MIEKSTQQTELFDAKMIGLLLLLVVEFIAMQIWGASQSLDIRVYYTGDQARELLASFNEAQWQGYITNEFIDLCFIATYTVAFLLGYSREFFDRKTIWVIGLIPGIFDLIETSVILRVLLTTSHYELFDNLGVVTFVKWFSAFFALAFLLLKYLRK